MILTVAIRSVAAPPKKAERYIMTTGDAYVVNRHGWIVTDNGEPVPHPLVDDVMRAILRFEGDAS